MSSSNSHFKDLIDTRNAIILLEISALLHDLGKLSKCFLIAKSRNAQGKTNCTNFMHGKILDKQSDEYKHFWNTTTSKKFLSILSSDGPEGETFLDFLNKQIFKSNLRKIQPGISSFGEILEKHHCSCAPRFTKIFIDACDRLDSGIDKGACVNANKQNSPYYLASPYGTETKDMEIKLDNIEQIKNDYLEMAGDAFYTFLQNMNMKKNNFEIFFNEWRKSFYESTKKAFVCGIGETRRAANDVTLWDHSFSSASLFKSFLAGIILKRDLKDPKKAKWRLLSIRFNGYEYITKSLRLSDLLGRKERLTLALNLVQDLLEFYIPLGNEVYRDENGCVFLVPDESDDDTNNDPSLCFKKIGKSIKLHYIDGTEEKEIAISGDFILTEAIEEIFKKVLNYEIKPIVILSEPSRGAVNLGHELERVKIPLVNNSFADELNNYWNENKDLVACTICRLKPALRNKIICKDCMKNRMQRISEWNKTRRSENASTIWIDEVSDKNGRVALIIGSFDLQYWINGMWLNTFFIKTLEDYRDSSRATKEDINLFHNITNFQILFLLIKEILEKDNNGYKCRTKFNGKLILTKTKQQIKTSELLKKLAPEAFKPSVLQPSMFFNNIVVKREADVVESVYKGLVRNQTIDTIGFEEKARLLLLSLFRKTPSFARIRRIWNTTKSFWDEIESKIKSTLPARNRYILEASGLINILNQKQNKKAIQNLKENRIYDLLINGVLIPVMYLGNEKFLVIMNLEALGLAETLDLTEKELNKLVTKVTTFKLMEPSDEYTQRISICELKKEDLSKVKFSISKEASETYSPYVTILKDPSVFMCLVPLQDAFEIAKLIKREYEVQFSKVQNRLPLKLGIIGFKRKFPLYVVFDTAKRFLNAETISPMFFSVKQKEDLSRNISAEEKKQLTKRFGKNFKDLLGNYVVKLTLSDEEEDKNLVVYVSYSTGDPTVEDTFYPYFVLKDGKDEWETLLYTDYINKLKNKGLVKWNSEIVKIKHVKNLDSNDKILFEPSLFDFVFIDSNLRRFDFGEEKKHWLFRDSKMHYFLWDIDKFERLRELLKTLNITTTQIRNLYELLLGKLEDWNITVTPIELKKFDNTDLYNLILDLIESAIFSYPLNLELIDGDVSTEGKITKVDYDFLKESILNGLFFDFVNLFFSILKYDFDEMKEVD